VAIHFQKAIENSKKIEGKFPLTPLNFQIIQKKRKENKKLTQKSRYSTTFWVSFIF